MALSAKRYVKLYSECEVDIDNSSGIFFASISFDLSIFLFFSILKHFNDIF